jgi:4a-hydroxytetrahydrobiopterin dehydratase
MAELMTDDQVTEALRSLPSWSAQEDSLMRIVEMQSFAQAIQVVNRVAEIAENDDHHPDIDIRWRTLTFRVSTHSKGGVTELDISLANEIDGVIDALG